MNPKQALLHQLIQKKIFTRGDIVQLLGYLVQNQEMIERLEFRLSPYESVQCLVLKQEGAQCHYWVTRNGVEVSAFNGRIIWGLLNDHFPLPLHIVLQYKGWEHDPLLISLLRLLHKEHDPDSTLSETERKGIYDWMDALVHDTSEPYKRVRLAQIKQEIDEALEKRDLKEFRRLVSLRKQMGEELE